MTCAMSTPPKERKSAPPKQTDENAAPKTGSWRSSRVSACLPNLPYKPSLKKVHFSPTPRPWQLLIPNLVFLFLFVGPFFLCLCLFALFVIGAPPPDQSGSFSKF